jgi:hypothetical protein
MPVYETKLIGKTQSIVLRSDTRPFLARKINPSRFPELAKRMHLKPPAVRPLPAPVETSVQPVQQALEPLPSWYNAPDLYRRWKPRSTSYGGG